MNTAPVFVLLYHVKVSDVCILIDLAGLELGSNARSQGQRENRRYQ
jgi:hypothetical protein